MGRTGDDRIVVVGSCRGGEAMGATGTGCHLVAE